MASQCSSSTIGADMPTVRLCSHCGQHNPSLLSKCQSCGEFARSYSKASRAPVGQLMPVAQNQQHPYTNTAVVPSLAGVWAQENLRHSFAENTSNIVSAQHHGSSWVQLKKQTRSSDSTVVERNSLSPIIEDESLDVSALARDPKRSSTSAKLHEHSSAPLRTKSVDCVTTNDVTNDSVPRVSRTTNISAAATQRDSILSAELFNLLQEQFPYVIASTQGGQSPVNAKRRFQSSLDALRKTSFLRSELTEQPAMLAFEAVPRSKSVSNPDSERIVYGILCRPPPKQSFFSRQGGYFRSDERLLDSIHHDHKGHTISIFRIPLCSNRAMKISSWESDPTNAVQPVNVRFRDEELDPEDHFTHPSPTPTSVLAALRIIEKNRIVSLRLSNGLQKGFLVRGETNERSRRNSGNLFGVVDHVEEFDIVSGSIEYWEFDIQGKYAQYFWEQNWLHEERTRLMLSDVL